MIIHSHNTSNAKGGLIGRYLHKLNRFVFANQKFERLACGPEAGMWCFPGGKFTVIENAVDMDQFTFNECWRKDLQNKINPDHKLVIGHVGRLTEAKNHKFLIEIFAQYVSVNNNAKLVLVGDGELRKEIEALVTQKNIGGKVIFTGVRQDIPNLLQAMDLLIFPSFKEGLPLSLVEAQCAGLSVVASDTIDHDCSILPSFQFCSLNDSPKQWLDKIKNAVSLTDLTKRAEAWKQVRDDGYDIEDTCSFITRTY